MLLKRLTFLCAILPLTLTTLACGDTDDDNGGDPTPATDYERPAASEDIVSNAELDAFVEKGFHVNEGLTPPNPSGTYLFDQATTLYTSSDIYPDGVGEGCDYEDTLVLGTNDDEILVTSEGVGNCELSIESNSNIISGDEGCFTLYGELNGTFNGCSFTALRVFSACIDVDSGDLLDPLLVEQMREVEGASCAGYIEDGAFPGEGVTYIVEQADGLATRVVAGPDFGEVGDGSD